jgi:hypothetical protein
VFGRECGRASGVEHRCGTNTERRSAMTDQEHPNRGTSPITAKSASVARGPTPGIVNRATGILVVG